MARPVVILALVLLACVPSVAAVSADDSLAFVAGLAADDGGCVHTEDESDEGPVKVGQEEPGVFVGIPGGGSEDASADGDAGAKDLPGLDGPFSGVGVFIRNRDCELPGVDDLQSFAAQVA